MITQDLCKIPLTNTASALLALKIKRGFYMGGSIVPDQARCACGGSFSKKQFKKQDYWDCDQCSADPKYFRLRRYLPGIQGTKGKTVEIRYDQNGNRLTDIDSARATRSLIDLEIQLGKFDSAKYLLKESEDALSVKNIIENGYLPYYEKLVANGAIKPSTMKAKKQYIRNYILPYFTGYKLTRKKQKRISKKALRGKGYRPHLYEQVEVNWASRIRSIMDISNGTIREMYATLPCSKRQRDLVGMELKVILNYAKDIADVKGFIVPSFPECKPAKLMDVNTFLSPENFRLVIDKIRSSEHIMPAIMIEMLWEYGLRPCDICPLKWSDINFKDGIILIRRHVTLNREVADGRKSLDGEVHALPITETVFKLLQEVPRSVSKDAYVFQTYKWEMFSPARLGKVWREALRSLKIPYVDLYRGTKSSRVTYLLNDGCTEEEIMELTGIKNVTTIRRYAQLLPRTRVSRIKNLISRSREA